MEWTMKKTIVGVLSVAMVASIGATSVFAAGSGPNFVDTNSDGICDYAGSACRHIDTDNDKTCENCGMSILSQTGYGRNFVDTDGNGICDNYASRQGMGQRRGLRGGCNR